MATASVRLIAVIRRATPRLPSRRYGRQAVRLESDRVSAWTGILAHGRVGKLRYGLRYGHQKGAGWIIQLAPDLGGAKGVRTPDLLHAMQTRYQLRHSPAAHHRLLRTGAPRKVERS